MSAVAGRTNAKSRSRTPLRGQRRRGPAITLAIAAAIVALAILGLFIANRPTRPSATSGAGQYPFQIGHPAPGESAPAFQLQATDGTAVDAAGFRGQTVLLFFQEGIVCEPCWTQIKDMEAQWGSFRGLGVDRLVTITADPLSALKVKVADERITTPVLSDPGVAVSRAYQTTSFGMHPGVNGHSFVLVGPDGVVRWRADYGGPPKFSMYLPIATLIADMQNGQRARS